MDSMRDILEDSMKIEDSVNSLRVGDSVNSTRIEDSMKEGDSRREGNQWGKRIQ